MTDMNGSSYEKTNFRGCPNCSSKMVKGHLQTSNRGVSRVYLEPEGSENNTLGYIPVSVWFCRNCGQVLLFAEVIDQDSQ